MSHSPLHSPEDPEIQLIALTKEDGVVSRTFAYSTVGARRLVAEIVQPEGVEAGCPAILYVHWYEPTAHDSNRTQFREEAREMAKRGAVCMMIETVWSDPDWFYKRRHRDDLNITLRQMIELRQAMDLILGQPMVDVRRLAVVGHDFGGMFAVLTGSIDPRPTHYVVMASTPRFHEWYFYFPHIDEDAKDDYKEEMAMYDPINRVKELKENPILFQFAEDDFHVPIDRAEEFFAAANDPKEIKWYESGHGLNDKATQDRIAWLTQQLSLKDVRS